MSSQQPVVIHGDDSASSSSSSSSSSTSKGKASTGLGDAALDIAERALSLKLGQDWSERTDVAACDVEAHLRDLEGQAQEYVEGQEDEEGAEQYDIEMAALFRKWVSTDSIACCSGCMELVDSDADAGNRCGECTGFFCSMCSLEHWPQLDADEEEEGDEPTCNECLDAQRKNDAEQSEYEKERAAEDAAAKDAAARAAMPPPPPRKEKPARPPPPPPVAKATKKSRMGGTEPEL